MAIVNRNLDVSQQRHAYTHSYNSLANGVTRPLIIVPNPCILDAAQMAINGVSGAPTYQLFLDRFVAGAGATKITLSSATAAANFGTSGVLASGISILAPGSSLLLLQANDCITVVSGGGAGAACDLAFFSIVLRPVQDNKTYFGVV